MKRLRLSRPRPSSPELPFSDSPSDRLARAVPGAVLLPAPRYRTVRRRAADGLEQLLLVRSSPPPEAAWHVVVRGHCLLAVGASPAEAVDRAVFLHSLMERPGVG
jgi:hypothetical protein